MKFIFEPTVYLIGKQQTVEDEVSRFLEDHEIEGWSSDAHSPAEKLVEIGGRTCYMSYTKPRPGGNSSYIKHIKEVGHGCYDEETEVLTENGWKKWTNVTLDDKFATLNLNNNEISYHKPYRLIKYKHNGVMYKVNSNHVDLLVTPNHNMVACRMTTLKGRLKEDFALIKAEDLDDTNHCYLKSGRPLNIDTKEEFGHDLMCLLGFSIGDGSIGERSNQIKFHLHKSRKIQYLKYSCKVLKWSIKQDIGNNRYIVSLPDDNKIISLFRNIYNNKEKQIPQNILTKLSKDEANGLLDGLIESDGHIDKNQSVCFDTTSSILPGQFQQLCLHLGLAANITYTYDKSKRESSFGDKPLTRLTIIKKHLKPEINRNINYKAKSEWVKNWSSNVYCAEVPNNTLYVRRNGIPVWSGNSVTEHTSWTFLITGVSRSLSHELVRHRHFNFSQLSQRYVDESECNFVVPPEIRKEVKWATSEEEICATIEGLKAGEDWVKSVKDSHKAYIEQTNYLFNKLVPKAYLELKLGEAGLISLSIEEMLKKLPLEKRTELRKIARQTARSLLPNATETKIVVTVNARSLRNFLELRGSSHAETEIRVLSNKILDIIVKESPALFNDYEKIPLEDGTYELVTKFKKI